MLLYDHKRWIHIKKYNVLLMMLSLALSSQAGTGFEDEGTSYSYTWDPPTVVTASLTERSLDSVPGTMTVITQKQIQTMGLVQLIDVFDLIPGMTTYITSFGSRDVMTRRFSNSWANTKVMIDGRPVNEVYHRQLHAYSYFPLENVTQIEILRGPGSALYGTDAFTGVVNIIMKKEPQSALGFQVGEWDREGYHLAYSGNDQKDVYFGFSLDHFKEEGDDLTYEKDWLSGLPVSFTPNTRDFGKEFFGAHGALRLFSLDIEIRHAKAMREWTEGYVNIQSPGEEWLEDSLTYVNLKKKWSWDGGYSLQLRATHDWSVIQYDGQLFPPGFDWATIYGIEDFNRDGISDAWPEGAYYDSGMETERTLADIVFTVERDTHQFILGAEWGRERIGDTYTITNVHTSYLYRVLSQKYTHIGVGDTLSPIFNVGEGDRENHHALFLQDIWRVNHALEYIIGARYDDYEHSGQSFSPRMALIWNYWENQILKISYGEAFFVPYPAHEFTTAFGFVGNPDLNSSTIQTLEVSFQNQFNPEFHFTGTAYYSRIRDLIQRNSTQRPNFFNQDAHINYQGVELEFRWNVRDTFSLWGNYAWADGSHESDGSEREGFEHLLKAGFDGAISEHWLWSTFLTWNGEWSRGSSLGDPHSEAIDPYTLIHGALTYTGIPNVKISLSVRNAFDEQYTSRNEIPGLLGNPSSDFPNEGRQYILKVNYRFK